MSDAIKKLHDYLAKSPSVIYPEDVLAYLFAIEAENAKLWKLAHKMAKALGVNSNWCFADCAREFKCNHMDECPIAKNLAELGVEVDGG